jgi:hypothetical protein
MSLKRKGRPCDTCGNEDAKYTCPSCQWLSCSLPCVQHHKKELNCTGKRSVTDFVPLSTYNDVTLRDDYFFLENTLRFVDSTSRDKLKNSNKHNWRKNKNLDKVKDVCKSRGITLYLAPPGLSCHHDNTTKTFFSKQTKKMVIMWKIQWNFVDCSVKFTDKCVSEESLLQGLLDKYIHHSKSDPVLRYKLRPYVTSYSDTQVFMKIERKKEKEFYLLDKTISLVDNLRGKLILEHPVFWVTCSAKTESDFLLKEHCKTTTTVLTTTTNSSTIATSAIATDGSTIATDGSSIIF